MRQTDLQCTVLGIMGNREQWGESPFDFNRIYLEGWTDIYIYILSKRRPNLCSLVEIRYEIPVR